MMSAAQKSMNSLRYDRALSRAVLARSRAHGANPALEPFQAGESCTTGEAMKKHVNGLHTCTAPRRSLDSNTSHCGGRIEQRQEHVAEVTFGTPQHQSSCHLDRCFMLSMRRRCHLVVISKSLRMCLWTSTCHRRDAHETRQASRNRLISSSQVSLRRELKPPLIRCQELPTQPCLLLKNTFFAQCHMGNAAPVTCESFRVLRCACTVWTFCPLDLFLRTSVVRSTLV